MGVDVYTSLWDHWQLYWSLLRDWRKHYRVWPVQKADGSKRWLQAPLAELKAWQLELLPYLHTLPVHPAARAYRPGGQDNIAVAREHLQHMGPQGWMVTADIRDFFGHIRISHLLHAGVIPWVAEVITIPHPRRGRVLPQGAPTSPVAANLAMYDFDQAVQEILPAGVLYTRWADDLGFSAPEEFDWRGLRIKLKQLSWEYGLALSSGKFKVMSPASGRSYLGISLNHEVRPARRFRRRLRSKLHHWQLGDTSRESVEGMVNYERRIRNDRGCGSDR